jgi:peptidoglycan hydrolase-like protein with peptidoglycan-binding domain
MQFHRCRDEAGDAPTIISQPLSLYSNFLFLPLHMDLQTIARGQTTYPISTVRQDRALVQMIQSSLNRMGFSVGSVDGIWGQGTDSAYRRFAQEYGFRPDSLSPRVARFLITTVGVQVPQPSPAPIPRPTPPSPAPAPRPTPRPTPSPPQTDTFGEALRFSLRWEGGYVNHPSDPGGETNKGVTANTYATYRRRKGLSPQSVRYITDAEVYEIYRDMYWRPANCDLKARPLAIVHFDTAVNFGVGGSTLFLQEVLGITVDGGYGPVTRAALERANNYQTARRYCQARIDYRHRRVQRNPSQRVFLAGWLNRDNDLARYISTMA